MIHLKAPQAYSAFSSSSFWHTSETPRIFHCSTTTSSKRSNRATSAISASFFRSLVVSVVSAASAPSAIVCLVDGVSFIETTARKPGLEILVAFLQQLVLDINELGGLLVFKVLLTYPYMSNYAHDWFPPEVILTMGEGIGGDGQGYNSVRLSSASESLVLGPPGLHRYSSAP
jgi:hypothetical protein